MKIPWISQFFGWKTLGISLCLALFSFDASGASPTVSVSANLPSIGRYDIYELTMIEAGSYTNPWEDVTTTAVFTAPSGKTYTVGGFYYDTGTWKLRFAPMEVGNWTWSLTFDNGVGQYQTSGSLACVASSRTGFVKIHPTNPRALITEGDGRPFYPIGFDKGSYTGRGGIDAPDFPGFLQAYHDAGANMIRDNCQAEHTVATNNYGTLLAVNGFNSGGTGKNQYDNALAKTIDSYYQTLHANDWKLFAAFMLHPNSFSSTWDVSNPNIASAFQRYHKYMINRFGAYVDIWELCNEASPGAMTQSYLDLVTNVCATYDPYQHPITVSHDQNQLDQSALKIVSPHRYNGDTNVGVTSIATSSQSAHTSYPTKALIFGEEGNYTPYGKFDPLRYRLKMWAAFTNQGYILPWVVDFDKNTCEAGANITNVFIGYEGREYTRVFMNLVSDFDPAATPITATRSSQLNGWVLGSSQDIIGYFTHANNHYTLLNNATVTLTVPASGMLGSWIDPLTGTTLQSFTPGIGSQTLTLPNFRTDLLLRIRAATGTPQLDFGEANYPVTENQGTVTISVNRKDGGTGAVSVDYSASDGDASDGRDYIGTNGTLSWGSGDMSPKTFTVQLLDNDYFDDGRYFTVKLSNPAGGAVVGNNGMSLVTIRNDDFDRISLTQTSHSVSKTSGSAQVTLVRVGKGNGPAVVGLNSTNITASASDYTGIATSGTAVQATVSWADGDVSPKTVSIPVFNNLASSGTKTFRFEIIAPQGTETGMAYRTTVNITDPLVSSAGIIQFKNVSYFENVIGNSGNNDMGYAVTRAQGNAIIPVSRVSGSAGAVSVSYSLVAGNAVAGTDFTSVNGTLTWADGETADKTISVPILANAGGSGHVVTYVFLSAPTGGAVINGYLANRAALMLADPNLPPLINAPILLTGTTGVPFSFQIAATSTPTGYVATGLPSGLSVNPATGLISGTPDTAGSYPVVLGAVNTNGTGKMNVVISISPATPVAPTIVADPVSVSVIPGQATNFSVTATGTQPLSYQWKLNGQDISGATGSTYAVSSPLASDNGKQYSVSVTNATGSVTSANATLTVSATAVAPVISLQPTGQVVGVGQKATFQAGATGTGPLYYQWMRNGVDIGGATNPWLLISPATAADNGSTYALRITGAVGTATTSAAMLTVSSGVPVITSIPVVPASAGVTTGTTRQFAATAKDQYGAPMSPQPAISWTLSGGGSIDANGLFTAGGAAGGPYTVTATSGAVSGTASVTVTLPPPVLTTITLSPSSIGVLSGGSQQFTATAKDQYGAALISQPTFTWAVGGGGSIDSTGLFTAGNIVGGPYTVTATSGGVSGSAAVSISAASTPVLTAIELTPGNAGVAAGGTLQFAASAKDQHGVTMASQPSITWSVSGGGTIDVNGLLTAGGSAGEPYTVTASGGGKSGTANLTVTAPVILFDDALRNGCTFQGTGNAAVNVPVHTGTMAFGATASAYAQIGLANSNLVIPIGKTTLKFYVYVQSPATSVSGFLAQIGAPSYTQKSFSHTSNAAYWTLDGSTTHLNMTMIANTWHEITLDLAGAFGASVVPGTTKLSNVTVQFTNASETVYMDDAILTAPASVFTSVSTTPANATVQTSSIQQFRAIALDQYGWDLAQQPAFTWSVGGGGAINASGLFSAGLLAGGPYTVTAGSGGKTGTANVTVQGAAINNWKIAKFGASAGNPLVSGDLVVNNGAGISNLMAYALGLDPYTATVSSLPTVDCISVSGTDYLTLSFDRNAAATDISYIVQGTSNLADPNGWGSVRTWSGGSWSPSGNVLETGSAPLFHVNVQDTTPAVPRRFLRLQIVR